MIVCNRLSGNDRLHMTASAPALRLARAATVVLAAALAAAACAPDAPRSAPPDAAGGADRLLARSLADPGLRAWLAAHGAAPRPSEARPPEAWTPDALAAAAIYFDRGVALARARWRQAAAAEASAARGARPALEPALAWDSRPDSPGDSPLTVAMAVSVPLDAGGRRAARLAAARAETRAAALDALRRGWARRAETRRAALARAAAESAHDGAIERLRIHERIAAVHERRYRLGESGPGAVWRARRDMEAAARGAARLAGAAEAARARLAAALGAPAAALAALRIAPGAPESAAAPPPASARRDALTGRLDILAALARHDAAEARLALEIARQRPEFTLEPGLAWDQGGVVWSLGAQVGAWLFRDNEGPAAEAAAARDAAARAVLALQARILAELDAAAAARAAARARSGAARAAAARAAEGRAAAARRFAAGETGRLETLEAELAAAAARGEEAAASFALLDAAFVWEDALEQAAPGAPREALARMILAETDP